MLRTVTRRWPVIAVLPVLISASWVTIAPPYKDGPPIRSDGLGYYAWTDAILTGNFDFCQWSSELDLVAALTSHNPEHPNRCDIRYTPGLALLRFPVMGPIAALDGGAKTLTVGRAEERCDQWLGVAALLLAVLLMALTMRRLGADPLVADLTTAGATFGTGLFSYGTFDASFTHVYDAALFAGLLFCIIRYAQARRRPNPYMLFGITFFIAFIREQNIVVLVSLTAVWALWWTRRLPRSARLREAAIATFPVLSAAAIAVIMEVLYNRWASGTWKLSPYDPDQKLSLTGLHEPSVLFAYDHGLFTYYPIVAVLLVAPLVHLQSRRWGYVAMIAGGSLTVVYGSWNQWDLGGAFGQRGLVDVMPFIAVAGALGISQLGAGGRALALGLSIVCVVATLGLMGGYWGGSLPFTGPTAHQYWSHVVGSQSAVAFLGLG